MATHLTADTHFGHPLVISDKIQARRPFASIQEHDETRSITPQRTIERFAGVN